MEPKKPEVQGSVFGKTLTLLGAPPLSGATNWTARCPWSCGRAADPFEKQLLQTKKQNGVRNSNDAFLTWKQNTPNNAFF